MKVSHILLAMLACAPLTLARATASSGDGNSPMAAADSGEAAGRTAFGRDTSTKTKGRDAVVAVSPRPGSVSSQRGVGQLARGTADRLHSLPSTQARARLARQPSRRPVGTADAATGGDGVVRGPGGASPVRQSSLRASTIAARSATGPSAVARGSTMGNLHAPGPGLVGGPANSRTVFKAGVDGTALRRRF
jgi:hypothetical protein